MSAPVLPSLILDDPTMIRMLSNPQIVAEFPFMAPTAQAIKAAYSSGKRRSCCGGGAAPGMTSAAQANLFNGIRTSIASLPPERKDRLKQLMGTQQLRMYWINSTGQKDRLAF